MFFCTGSWFWQKNRSKEVCFSAIQQQQQQLFPPQRHFSSKCLEMFTIHKHLSGRWWKKIGGCEWKFWELKKLRVMDGALACEKMKRKKLNCSLYLYCIFFLIILYLSLCVCVWGKRYEIFHGIETRHQHMRRKENEWNKQTKLRLI